ncbi:MAG: SDR family oxidoreductase [Nanoarchaeota archaeon]|nr:SDR family oxidoreductase [Nanoarchaeota archaeon]
MDNNIIDKYQKLFSLENKVAIVTGAYGHLGTAISKTLAAFGANVILIGRNQQKLEDFVNKNQSLFKNRFEYFVCDVTNQKEFQKIVEKVVSDHGTVDILVNNAYAKSNENFEGLTKSEWNRALEYSLTHYFTCTQAISPIMLKSKSGSIINIASIYSFLGVDHRIFLDLENNPPIHYAVSKGGILQMTRYLSTLWADKGIRVNAISPGYFPKKRLGVPERPDYIHEITKRTPMRRIGQPDDLAGAVVFLASDASSFITGQNLIVDGGWSVW